MWFQELTRYVVVGLLTVLVGLGVAYLLRFVMPVHVAKECQHWNDHHVMEVSLFLTGMVLQFVLVIFGHYLP